ncbi:MAG: hypothetical protein ABI624_00985 [Casimicrobiaceae bacterium]
MFTLRTHAIICAALFAALIGTAIVGNVLEAGGVAPLAGAARYIAIVFFFGLFIAFGLSAIPVMVMLVLRVQVNAGNRNVPAIAAVIRRQSLIIWSLWGLIVAGLCIALPAMIMDGAFGDGPQQTVDRAMQGPHLGTLSVRPDMSLDEVGRQSTLKLDLKSARPVIAGGGVFDYVIPGTAIRLPNARYYYLTTYSDDHSRIRAVNIGTSPAKMTLAELASADAQVRALLVKDGWLAGHEVYRDRQDQALHDGATEGPEGRMWRKDGMILDIERKRMDDEKAGEDKASAGAWIQFIDLLPAKDYPWIERFVFQPARVK